MDPEAVEELEEIEEILEESSRPNRSRWKSRTK